MFSEDEKSNMAEKHEFPTIRRYLILHTAISRNGPILHQVPTFITTLSSIYHYLTTEINGGKSNFLKDICAFQCTTGLI